MEFLIFLLIIASAFVRGKKDNKNKQSAREREAQRRRAIQSAWEDAWEMESAQSTEADEWDKAWSSPKQGEKTRMGSYVPQDAAPAAKPASAPEAKREPVQTALFPSAPMATVKERTKAAVSAMKELQNTVKGSLDFDSAEGEGSKEGRSRYNQKHAVKPFTEATHLHTESSITGIVPCPTDVDVYAAAPAQPAMATPAAEILGSITGDELRRAIIYSEILGKPKGRR